MKDVKLYHCPKATASVPWRMVTAVAAGDGFSSTYGQKMADGLTNT